MRLKLIACKVFFRELCRELSVSPHVFDVEFLDLGEHARPAELRQKLQERIDQIAAGPEKYDAVLLGYGLCGRATDTLTAKREKLILMRSHDCCTVLLGSREEYLKHFGEMPSTPFSSNGFVDHGSYIFDGDEVISGYDDSYAKLVETYGEEDAKYIYDAMHPKLDGKLQPVYFIRMPGIPDSGAEKKCMEKAAEEEREFRTLEGSFRMLHKFIAGEWDDGDFLTVPAGRSVHLVGDQKEVIRLD